MVLRLVGWRGDWVLVYGGHDGCFGLGVWLLGLMILASFAGAGGFALWALSWAWDIFCVSFVH